MSIITNIDDLPWETKQRIHKDLEIKLENKYTPGMAKYVYPFEIIDNNIILPFSYAARSLKLKRPEREHFPIMNVDFEGILRDEQKEILQESINYLSTKGSVIISAYTGFGKCLGLNTPIIMYDGNIKMVQDIIVGDMLMGDDSKPRNVLSICRGQEQMYEIQPVNGDTFRVNESHILSLKLSNNKFISYICREKRYRSTYFDHTTRKMVGNYHYTNTDAVNFLRTVNSPDIIDISVKDYLKLGREVQEVLKCYKVGIDFPRQSIIISPHFLGYWLGKGVDINIDDLIIKYYSNFDKNELPYKTLDNNIINGMIDFYRSKDIINIHYIPDNYIKNIRIIRLRLLAGFIDSGGCYDREKYKILLKKKMLANQIVYLARSLGFGSYMNKIDKNNDNYQIIIYGIGLEEIPCVIEKKQAKPIKQNDALMSSFKVVPISEKNYYGFTIDGNHRFLLGDFTVTHNTICSIKLATILKFRILIVVNKVILTKQWKESILKFCPDARVNILTPKSQKEDADFYIMNAQNIEKMGKKYFLDIGTVIVDEAHLIMAETLSRSLQFVYPRYLIGLTATPYRPDGLDILLLYYFGSYKILRKLWRKHTVYRVSTGFKPTIEKAVNGRVNWGVVLDSQANDVDRNELIISLLKYFSDRTFLVLVKRISQGEYLLKRLREEGEDCTSLLGSNQDFVKDSRILVGTSGKVGVGFDHAKLDALLLGSDVEEYFIQYLGRVFRTKDVEPIIVDLVDKYSILEKHFGTRRSIYQEHGGVVKHFNLEELK